MSARTGGRVLRFPNRISRESFALLAVLSVAACASAPPDAADQNPMNSPVTCAANNGDWIPFSDLYPDTGSDDPDAGRYVCNLRTTDAGTPCRDSRQCLGYCISPASATSGQQVTGECSSNVLRPQDVLTVLDGRVTYPRWSDKMTERKADMLRRLADAREQWMAAEIDDYEITVTQACFCLYGPYYGPNHVVVLDGRISRVTYQGERRDGFRRGDSLTREDALKPTIEIMFDDLDRTIRRITANATLEVEYDPDYGFPTLVAFERPDIADEEYRLVVSSFRAL